MVSTHFGSLFALWQHPRVEKSISPKLHMRVQPGTSFCNDSSPSYILALSLHDALPISEMVATHFGSLFALWQHPRVEKPISPKLHVRVQPGTSRRVHWWHFYAMATCG